MTYIRQITLSLLCSSLSNQDFEDEFEDLLRLLNSESSIEIVVNLVKDAYINKILESIDVLVENSLSPVEKLEDDSIFEKVITNEAASFLYRLAKLA